MLDAKELQTSINASRNNLLTLKIQSQERAKLGRENAKKAKDIDERLQALIQARTALTETINYIVKIYKNIESYAEDRKALALDNLKRAVVKAGYIVPSADTEGIRLNFVDKKANIVNKLNQDINSREGSAFRAVLAVLMRYTLIMHRNDVIKVIFLDEALNTLSEETTVALRECFGVLKDDIAILGIEQHDTLFEGLEPTVYRAVKENGVTTIIKEN